MKIVANKGATAEPGFYNDYLTAAGMMKRMQEYLAAALDREHPDVWNQLKFAEAPDSASSAPPSLGSSTTRGKTRAKPKGVSLAPKMDKMPDDPPVKLEEVRSVMIDQKEAGKLLHLAFRDGVSATPTKQRTILAHLLGELNFRLRSETFQFLNDDGTTLKGYANADKDAEGEEILNSLTALPVVALPQFLRLNTGDGSDLPSDDKAAAQALLTPNRDLPRIIMWQTGSPLAWSDGGFASALAKALTSPIPKGQGVLLWIPDLYPCLFYDPVNWDTLYRPGEKDRYFPASYGVTYNQNYLASLKVNPNNAAKITGARYPFYAVTNKGLWSAAMAIPTQNWPKEGVGGQGAMRCDGPSEFQSSTIDIGGLLGRALGLEPNFGIGAAQTQIVPYPSFAGRGLDSQSLSYAKAYDPAAKKKNLPAATRPLSFFPPEPANPFITDKKARRREMKAVLKVSGFTMKQKGTRSFNTTQGLSVGTPVAGRVAANLVMRDALKTRFGNAIGQQSFGNWLGQGNWQGSATKLVAGVFAEDPVASAFWAEQSKALVLADGKTAAKAELKKVLRTDQEWCHLFGHGDGGEEVPDNFVAGSKHCNSEQLALELTQRLYRDHDLKVKITAYLMPSGLPVQAANWLALKALPELEKAIGTIVGEKPATVSARADRDARLKKGLADYFNAYAAWKDATARACTTSAGQIRLPSHAQATGMSEAETPSRDEFVDRSREALFPLMPIAYMMRYKVYVPRGNSSVKCIDHVYSGQREEMDYNEFQALQWSFRLRIAEALDGPQQPGVQGPLHAEVTALLEQKIAAL